jgi:hypothetical protein
MAIWNSDSHINAIKRCCAEKAYIDCDLFSGWGEGTQ